LGGGAPALANEVRAAKYAGVRLLLEADGNPVGVILLISSLRRIGDREQPFSDLSGWYVEPGFRGHATQLFNRVLANKQTTYLNVSAATHIRPIIEAFRFRRYSEGQVLSLLALARYGGTPATLSASRHDVGPQADD
jgi:hypothetical protein